MQPHRVESGKRLDAGGGASGRKRVGPLLPLTQSPWPAWRLALRPWPPLSQLGVEELPRGEGRTLGGPAGGAGLSLDPILLPAAGNRMSHSA